MVQIVEDDTENNCKNNIKHVNYSVLFDNEHDSDVTLIVGKNNEEHWRFPGHTQILGSQNVRLREMFRTMPPSRTVIINDVDKRGFEYLLRCLYHVNINFQKVETAINALNVGYKYQCLPLVEQSVKFIDLHLNHTNILDIIIEIGLPTPNRDGTSDQAKIEDYFNQLRHNCFVLIDHEASKVLENERFEDLTRDQVEFILQRDSLQPLREIHAWKALERWLDRECKRLQLENTNSMKRKILAQTERVVRYSLMKKSEFLSGPARILTSSECDEVFRQMKNKERRPRTAQVQPFLLNPKVKKRRFSTGSTQSNSSKVVKNRVYDLCFSCLVCVFD